MHQGKCSLVYDLMSYTEIHKIPGLLVLIDFEKAFDSISWSFIHKVFFLDWRIYYPGNNNFKHKYSCLHFYKVFFLSEQFHIQKGCRQGDPVVPYIFIIRTEILSILIKDNNDIKGIFVKNKEVHIKYHSMQTTLCQPLIAHQILARSIRNYRFLLKLFKTYN